MRVVMYMSNCDIEPGLPPAPAVRFLDHAGPMPPGHYWFAILTYNTQPKSDVSQNGPITIKQGGMDAMGPARHIVVNHSWKTVQLDDIPIDESRPYATIMMSLDGRNFQQIATAPAVNMNWYYDLRNVTQVKGAKTLAGMHRITIRNPAARYRAHTGTTVQRERAGCKGSISNQDVFTPFGEPLRIPTLRAFEVPANQPWKLPYTPQRVEPPTGAYAKRGQGMPLNF